MHQDVMQAGVEQDNLAATLQALQLLQESVQDLVLDEGQCLSLLNFAAVRYSKQLAHRAWQLLQATLASSSEGTTMPGIQPGHRQVHSCCREVF